MNLDELHQMGKELEIWLRMRVHPIAVKLLNSKNKVPQGAIIPTRDWKHKYALCQAFARSQDGHEETIAMFKEDHWCFEPVIGLGLAKRIPEFLGGHHRYPDSVKTLKAGAQWCKNMPYLPYGKYQGIVSAPIHLCNFIPDLIVMHVDVRMATYLMIIRNYIDGKDITCQLSGHAACVYAIVPSMLNRECHIALPCKGDRTIAFAQDNEIIFTLTPKMLPDFIQGIQYEQEHEWGLPFFTKLKEEYFLKPKYKAFGEKIGLDLNQSPPRPQQYEEF